MRVEVEVKESSKNKTGEEHMGWAGVKKMGDEREQMPKNWRGNGGEEDRNSDGELH